MKIALIGNPNSWYFRYLQRTAGLLADNTVEFQSLPFTTIKAQVQTGRPPTFTSNEQRFGNFDAVVVRTMPPGSLEQVIFRMNALHLFEQAGGLVLNCARSIEIAVDKYLSLGLLATAGVAVPETTVCQTADDAMQAFEEFGGDVVIKPVFGGEGRGITRVSDPALAIRAFRMLEQLEGIIYLQRFIDHAGFDIRIFVLGEQTYCMRRSNPNDWRTNISLGGVGEPYDAEQGLLALARQAADICQAEIAGVDIVFDATGKPVVLEVNAVPGWRELTQVSGIDIGLEVTRFLVDRIMKHQTHLTENGMEQIR